MAVASNLTDLKDAWSEFLTEMSRFFNMLRNGAAAGPAKGWNDKLWHRRTQDPLMSYLLHARNAEEHGIAGIAGIQPGRVRLKARQGNNLHTRLMFGSGGQIVVDNDTAAKLLVEFVPSAVELLPVVDRGITYQPPTEHLGLPISTADPITVAQLALSFARDALQQAKGFLR